MAEKRGITVKVEDELHRQVKEYIESHGMTMSDFVSQALEEMLHPKQQMGGNTMGAMRTIAFQVSEELYQKIKDYLTANHMTQKEFMIGLIQQELERGQQEVHEETVEESQDESEQDDEELDEDESEENDEELDEDDEELDEDEFEENDEELDEDDEELDEDESEENDEELDEDESPEMGM